MVIQRRPIEREGFRRSTGRPAARLWLGLIIITFSAACRAWAASDSPDASASRKVDYLTDIHPILSRSCARCHGKGKQEGGFHTDTRAGILAGGDSGRPGAIEGRSEASFLIELVTEKVPGEFMPKKGARLNAEEIRLLKAWIDQGMPWENSAPVQSTAPPPVTLRKIELPPATSSGENGIDRILRPYFQSHSVPPLAPAEDAVFARRASFDAVGLPPSPEELKDFIDDKNPDKRDQLVSRLLGRNRDYAEHWISFWSDLLANDFRGPGKDFGRREITYWLYTALATNKAYDQMARELIHPEPMSEGFIGGILWNKSGSSASQAVEVQAAQNVSQVFLGVNLKCASCHDSFVNRWKLADAYGMASIFSDKPMELVRCDVPSGKIAKTRFLFPELGSIDATQPRDQRLERLAGLVTQPENGRFARTIVNRLWDRLFGRGLVETLDDMDVRPWNEDLLDWLASEFVRGNYDIKGMIQLLMTSEAYQARGVREAPAEGGKFVFRGPAIRRLSWEQFSDTLSSVTSQWPAEAGVDADFRAGYEPTEPREAAIRESVRDARWIWFGDDLNTTDTGGGMSFRHTIALPDSDSSKPGEAWIAILSRGMVNITLNGSGVGARALLAPVRSALDPVFVDLLPHIRKGDNELELQILAEGPAGRGGLTGWLPGILVYGRIRHGNEVRDFVSEGHTWTWRRRTAAKPAKGRPEVPWKPVRDIGAFSSAPWREGEKLFAGVMTRLYGSRDHIRAWRVAPDPLAFALGRPNRESITSRRAVEFGRMQALEMSNGAAVWQRLDAASEKLIHTPSASDPRQLADQLFLYALGRPPTEKEDLVIAKALPSPLQPQDVQDFLWMLFMLPEFQFIA